MCNETVYKRGDVVLVDLGDVVGSEQGGKRPCCVIQNDVGNKFAPTLIVAPITSKVFKKPMPTHVQLSQVQYDTPNECVVLTEQIITIDKKRVIHTLFSLNDMDVIRVNKALMISMGLVAPVQGKFKENVKNII